MITSMVLEASLLHLQLPLSVITVVIVNLERTFLAVPTIVHTDYQQSAQIVELGQTIRLSVGMIKTVMQFNQEVLVYKEILQ